LAEIYIVGRKMISGAYVSQKWCKSFQWPFHSNQGSIYLLFTIGEPFNMF
jgi:hypothetical protein